MVEKLPSINNCFPTAENLKHFKNASDLVRSGKFPNLSDDALHILIGIKESYMTSFTKIRKPLKLDQPYIARCSLGWVPFGRDSKLKNESLVRCNYIRTVDEKLEKRLDTIIYESFAEKPNDDNIAPSVEDKLVLNSYKKSVKNVNGRFEIGLPFKHENVELPNNYQYVFDRMIKLDNRFRKNVELKENYFKFMGKLFEDGHAIELEKKNLND